MPPAKEGRRSETRRDPDRNVKSATLGGGGLGANAGQHDNAAQAGMIILEPQLAAVQARDIRWRANAR